MDPLSAARAGGGRGRGGSRVLAEMEAVGGAAGCGAGQWAGQRGVGRGRGRGPGFRLSPTPRGVPQQRGQRKARSSSNSVLM